MVRKLLCLFGLVLPLLASDGIPLSECRERRANLRKNLDGVMVVFANEPRDVDQLRDGVFQDPNFEYLTGWRDLGAALLVSRDEEILFLPPRNERMERYTGRKVGADDPDAAARTGFDKVLSLAKLETNLVRLLGDEPKVYVLGYQAPVAKIRPLFGLHEEANAQPLIARLRMKKSEAELALLQKAADATMEAHRAAWKRMRPGLSEYQIAATMEDVYHERGCERNAYAPIVGSGPNSVVLHYSADKRRMDNGEVVVMDVGAECSSYAADITRTVPVGGKFTPRQREIYEVVLGAQKAAIAAIKPGVMMSGPHSLQQIAKDYMDQHGKDLHGAPLGKYFIHGLGHDVGLDVHDASIPMAPLESGRVITIEPGIYIPEEGIGVRIEDMVLVTEQGARVLTGALPKEPDEIERLVGK